LQHLTYDQGFVWFSIKEGYALLIY